MPFLDPQQKYFGMNLIVVISEATGFLVGMRSVFFLINILELMSNDEKLRSCCLEHKKYSPGCTKCKLYRSKYERNRRHRNREGDLKILTYDGIKVPRDRKYDNRPKVIKTPVHKSSPGNRCDCQECWDTMKRIGEKFN